MDFHHRREHVLRGLIPWQLLLFESNTACRIRSLTSQSDSKIFTAAKGYSAKASILLSRSPIRFSQLYLKSFVGHVEGKLSLTPLYFEIPL